MKTIKYVFIAALITLLVFLSGSSYVYKKKPGSDEYIWDIPAVVAASVFFSMIVFGMMKFFGF